MPGYEKDLAFTHDAGFTRLAALAADRLLAELDTSDGDDRGVIVELGCGPGVTAAQLVSAGFDVVGIDQSAPMLDLARVRAPRATFVQESWVTAEIPPCDAVIAVGEVFNYQFDPAANLKAAERTFARIFKALWPGGIFLFDVAGPGRVQDDTARTVTVGDDWAVIAENVEDAKKGTLTRTITALRKSAGGIVTTEEVHRQRLIPPAKVLAMLRKAGFRARSLQGYDGERFAPGHSVFLARRP